VIVINKNVVILTELRDILGVEKFKAFVGQHSGETIYLPKRGEFVSLEERNQAMLSEFYSGASITELSEKYGISGDMVYKIARNGMNQL
jgi:Mor family transcriptional regulator